MMSYPLIIPVLCLCLIKVVRAVDGSEGYIFTTAACSENSRTRKTS